MRAAVLLLAAAAAAAAAPAPQEDPWTLRFNPLRQGLQGWTRTGPDKAFAWSEADQTLTIKGQSGRDPPRIVHAKTAWDRGGVRFQAKKGARKVRVVLVPQGEGKPVALEFPRDAVGAATWTDLAMRMTKGKASLLAAAEGGGEKEVASAELPDGVRYRIGFEAPSGTDAVLGLIRFERVHEEEPQFCEPDFQPLFDGTGIAPWVAGGPGSAVSFRAEKGVLVGEPRAEDFGWLAIGGGRWTSYELRLNAMWGTTHLDFRAVEVSGRDGKIDRFGSVHVNFTDHLDPEGVNALVLRLAGGKVIASVDGKQILDAPVKETGPTPISFFVGRGRRCALRDIRIKDLAPGTGSEIAQPLPRGVPKSEGPPKPATWEGSGGVAAKDGVWSVEDAAEDAGLLCGASLASYELRFSVARGADGLAVVPRANRGLRRATGLRLDASLFAKEEWTEVVLRVVLLRATVSVAGKEAGTLDLDVAFGPPGIRVDAGGRARLKDLAVEATK